ncbi:hypothetical protein [Corynebacterium sp.]|uniref:hypothetical protein n=1 Tax=Corynebacterium sp. TaxID=1720 RepID=UPI0026DD2B74|nr:hypothetical protein [Corynebacterium sp.]MDO5031638.1 hypothetical protein [Corynebacterium sp.]
MTLPAHAASRGAAIPAPTPVEKTTVSRAAATACGVLAVLGVLTGMLGGSVDPLNVAVAHAQDGGMDASFTVPTGQTTTVSLPVPVEVNFAAEGWSVTASGGSATVTAPAEGGQITVPVSYQGMSAQLTLIADADTTAEDVVTQGEEFLGGQEGAGDSGAENPEPGQPGAGQPGGEEPGGDVPNAGQPGAGEAAPGARSGAGWDGVDTSATEFLNLEATTEGNAISAQLGLRQALDLYNRFKAMDHEGVTLRYLNAQGEFIQGVERSVDKASRTLTLRYPEGQEPDNPFILQLVKKDTQEAVLVVTLTDPHRPGSQDVPAEQQLGAQAQGGDGEEKQQDSTWVWLLAGGVLAVIGAALAAWWSRRKS